MDFSLLDSRTAIKYGSIFREYYIESSKGLHIDFCPWCGEKLLESLRDKFFQILELEYKIFTDIGEYWVRLDLPEEFKTDEWWKKRGL